jgi:hypothetical protein
MEKDASCLYARFAISPLSVGRILAGAFGI